jgi:hypothetical protein
MSKTSLERLDFAIVAFKWSPSVFSRDFLFHAAREHMQDLFLREQREVLEGRIILNDEEE